MKKNLLVFILTALFVALALVTNLFTRIDVSVFGSPVVRISFGGIFTALSAILFGPVFGAFASGLTDVVGFILKPIGSYIPLITLTAIIGGFLRGILWMLLKKANVKNTNSIYIISIIFLLLLSIANHVALIFYPDGFWCNILNLLGTKKFLIVYLIDFIAAVGLVFYLINNLVAFITRDEGIHQNLLKLLITIGVAGLTETSLNTLILKPIYGWTGNTFYIIWVARLVEEIFMTVVKAFIISYILLLFNKSLGKKLIDY